VSTLRKPAPKQLFGVVAEPYGHFTAVHCENAPKHLQVIFMEPSQVGKAKPGDRVKLEYHSTPSYGLWRVTEILEFQP
jgi:hypothetical protein